MKTLPFFRPLAAAILLGAAPMSLLAQGPLTPPGPPAPTMKTLVEVEPRTHITSLPYTITASGSYYLTASLNGAAGAGIVIQASGVTVDLRGFSIENCTTGISAGASIQNVAVHNGIVRGCSGSGIDLGQADNVRLEQLIVSDNGGFGVNVGKASLVTLCTAKSNANHGIAIGSGGKVFQCVAQSNATAGIAVTTDCQVIDNNSTGHGSGAGFLNSGGGNRFEGNSANGNQTGFLINIPGNLIVRNNACSNTAADYTIGYGNNYGQILVSPGPAFASSNAWANFGCTGGQQIAICGDGIPSPGETCDDGNTVSGDGCSSTCQFEGCVTANDCPGMDTECQVRTCDSGVCGTGFTAAGTLVTSQTPGDCQKAVCDGSGNVINTADGGDPPADDGNQCTGQTCVNGAPASFPLPQGTPCNQNGGTTCNASGTCVGNAVCGDGVVQAGETCDDGNNVNGDGCTATCSVQSGYICTGSPSVCTTQCGDGVVSGNESCDDANGVPGDGCSPNCSVESGYNCVGSPSVCFVACGDGVVGAGETCDDANTNNGDGCSATCHTEVGYTCTGSPSTCADINECLTNNGGCNVNSTCVNQPGSYTCVPNPTLTTTKAGTGSGTLTSSPTGINCGADCSESYAPGTVVSISAAALTGSTFSGWSGGGCTGTGSCVVTMNSAQSVTGTFTLNNYSLTVSKTGTGSGTVSSTPSGITCGADCGENYSHGTVVTLTASPQAGSSFTGWGGACTGTGACNVTMTSARSVTATFSTP